MRKQQYITTTLIGLAFYLISTGVSFSAFTYGPKRKPETNIPTTKTLVVKTDGFFNIDPSIPRTETCPTNGMLYTKQEKEVWEARRPLAVMIENHSESRPQSGLSYADVVYEAVAEGGVTRFMGIFYCGIAGGPVVIAPVRSARTYFLPWVLEYDALYNHVGGAGRCNDDTVDERAKALCQIDQYRIKDMDQFGISFPTCYRNYDRLAHPVATEHTMVCVTDKLYKLAADRGWTNVDTKGVAWDKNYQRWKIKDDAKASDRGASFSASFTAWKGWEKEYSVGWEYDRVTNSYKRFNGGTAHIDLENGKQLYAKVIVIQYAKETGPVDIHAHLLYDTIGFGDALIFQDGRVTKGTWKKKERLSRTTFFDEKDKEISFNRGPIWIELLPIGRTIQY